MAEPNAQKKNKKGKKKSESSEVPAVSVDKDIKKCISVNNNLVSGEPAVKTSENTKEPVVNDTNETSEDSACKKKKKSKKKAKESMKENVAVNSNSESLLNFSENGIHLVNHPEISVTITDSPAPEDKEIKSEAVKVPPVKEEKPKEVAAPVVAVPQNSNDTDTAKKKKKKKNKNKNNNNNNSDSSSVVPSTPNENTVSTPTYTKVVTSDNTCVLVVNHESFSGNTKPAENLQSKNNNVSDKNINFSLPSEKHVGNVLITKNLTHDTNIQLNNSVSIFPVLTNGNSKDPEKQIEAGVKSESNSVAEVSSPPENTDESKTKAQLKAERRAKQEAQRAAKLAKSNEKTEKSAKSVQENKNPQPKEKMPSKENAPKTTEVPTETSSAKLNVEKESLHKVKLFSHLPQCKQFDCNTKIHPAILEIGFQYNRGMICGSNARCIALLEAFAEVIKDYIPHPERNFSRDLESNIQSCLSFLGTCRPLSVSMMNAVRFLKHEINQISSDMKIEDMKKKLCDFIYNFVRVEIVLAKEEIANRASYKIIDGDVILVLAFSSVVRDVLCKAHDMKKIFRVVVVDTRPKLEGLKMLRHLVKKGLQCSYISVNAVSYIMKEVTKVMIGAHALLANGCVMSRLGNKQISLIASTYGVPVFVCCETYKFCERVLTDSFVHNELGEPDDIIATSLSSNDTLKNWHDLPLLQPLNLLYDLTTPDLLSEIVTEKGTLPCTSVPVFLRVRFAGLS